MKILQCCVCGGKGRTTISKKNGERIVECTTCGMIYKSTIKENKKTRHYKSSKVWEHGSFDRRYKKIAKHLSGLIEAKEILDVGCANGAMITELLIEFPTSKCIGIEASKPVAKSCPIKVICGKFEEVYIPGKFDLVNVMGVDYLFNDHLKAIEKIKGLLKDEGHLYIERNIFQDMTSFMGKKITSDEVKYWNNELINTWFTKDLMAQYLSQHFTIENTIEYEEGGSKHVGFLCKK